MRENSEIGNTDAAIEQLGNIPFRIGDARHHDILILPSRPATTPLAEIREVTRMEPPSYEIYAGQDQNVVMTSIPFPSRYR
jgi:hypothetical protein